MEIPGWLQENINTECPYCGTPLTNNAMLTNRCCPNPLCPEHMARKMAVLAKRFGIRNFGVAAARQMIRRHHFRLHTQILPYWFIEKPMLYLYEVGEICLIKGHQKQWRTYCEGLDTMLQVVQSPRTPQEVRQQGGLLLCTAALCHIKPRLLGKRLNVMLSGTFDGYRSRADFVLAMNRAYGDVVEVVDVGKRKTEVAFLIKEAYATDHEKSAIARAEGIPMVTPSVFQQKLAAYQAYQRKGGGET